MKKSVLIFIIAIVAPFLILVASPFAEAKEDVQVFCYIGNPDDNECPGTVDVFDAATATVTCNMVYNDCEGRCIGCYDNEASEQICIDLSGRPYKN